MSMMTRGPKNEMPKMQISYMKLTVKVNSEGEKLNYLS